MPGLVRSMSKYHRVEDEEDEEALLSVAKTKDERVLGLFERGPAWLLSWSKLKPYLTILLLLTVYSFGLVVATLRATHRAPSSLGTNVFSDSYQTKIQKFIEYEPRAWEGDELGAAEYFGKPNPDIDARWHELLQPTNIGLPDWYMHDIGRLEEGVRLSDGSYFGSLMVFHHLHCLKNVYHGLHPEHYGLNNLNDKDKKAQDRHLAHCLHLLREAVMCQADTTVATMYWSDTVQLPVGNYKMPHKCVKWDRLLEWVTPRSFDVFFEQPKHPKLGNAFAGNKTELDFTLDRNVTTEE